MDDDQENLAAVQSRGRFQTGQLAPTGRSLCVDTFCAAKHWISGLRSLRGVLRAQLVPVGLIEEFASVGTDATTEGIDLILSYKTRELKRACLEPEYAIRQLGDELTHSLHARLADLDAADHLIDVPLGVNLDASTLNRIAVHILNHHYVIARADHAKIWTADSSEPDWSKVSRLQLTHLPGYLN